MLDGGTIECEWAGDVRKFRLPIAQLIALEEATDTSAAEILGLFGTHRWRVRHLTETMRLALIGGGMPGLQAKRLVEQNVVDGRLLEARLVCQAALAASMVARTQEERDQAGNLEVATEAPEANASPSPPSSEMAL